MHLVGGEILENRESGGIAPLILNLALVGSQWSTSRPGYSTTSEEPLQPFNMRLGGPQSPSGLSAIKMLCRLWDCPVRNLVVILMGANQHCSLNSKNPQL